MTDPTVPQPEGAAPGPSPDLSEQRGAAPLIIAILWAIAAAIIGFTFITGTPDEAYGGDAYTGIQQAAAQTARAIGWLIIGSGVIGLIIALSRR